MTAKPRSKPSVHLEAETRPKFYPVKVETEALAKADVTRPMPKLWNLG